MASNNKLNLQELKILVFEKQQATKQNKDRLFKLAKAEADMATIEKLRDELGFKSAKVYLEKLQREIFQYTINNLSINSIQELIDKKFNINQIDVHTGASLLHFASEQDNRIVIEFLIDNGADVNIQDKDGATPLLLAAQENNYETMKLLINSKADLNLESKHGYTPLMATVAKFNSIDAANILMDNGAEINIQDTRGVSPLMLAAQQNFGSIVIRLIQNGANPNIIDNYGYNSLHIPCERGHENVVTLLLQTNVNLNHQDKDGDTPLMIASKNGFKNIVEMLLNKSAKLDLQNNNGDTAIMRAVYGNHFEIVKLLAEKGAKLNLTSKDNYSVLAFSMSKNNKEMSNYLISLGAYKLPLKNQELNDYLLSASKSGDRELIQVFLDNGANKNYKGENGNTPLMLASTNNHLNIVQILINNNVDINLQNNDLCTPLWSASMYGHIDIVRLLLENGANPNIQVGEDKMTALFSVAGKRFNTNDIHVTTMNKVDENDITIRIARVLLQNDANPNIQNIHKSTVLNLSSRIGDLEMMKLLLDYNAQLDIQENTGLTALMAASHANHFKACKLLIENGATNVNQISSTQGATALTLAIENNNLEIVKLLVKEGADLDLKSTSTLAKGIFGVHPNDLTNGTPLELAKEYKFKEIEIFLNEHLEKIEKTDDLPKGYIKLEQNLSINIYNKYLLFKSKVGDEIFENKYIKTEKDTYVHDIKGLITIFQNYVVKKSKAGDETKYQIIKYTGNILDVDNSHNPKELSKILSKFSTKKLMYTNHDWDDNTLKYDDFIGDLSEGWSEIKESLNILAPVLCGNIEKFLLEDLNDENITYFGTKKVNLGWSSEKLKHYNPQGVIRRPEEFKNFNEMINVFKESIVIKDEDDNDFKLIDMFARVLDSLDFDIDIDMENIADFKIKFFTDVKKLETIIAAIIKENNHHQKNPELKVLVTHNYDKKYIDLEIIHKKSIFPLDANSLSDTIGKTGTFSTIYKQSLSLCDWSVMAQCSDGNKEVHYRFQKIDNDKPHINDIKNIEGFTHKLRFYI